MWTQFHGSKFVMGLDRVFTLAPSEVPGSDVVFWWLECEKLVKLEQTRWDWWPAKQCISSKSVHAASHGDLLLRLGAQSSKLFQAPACVAFTDAH